MFGTFLYGQSYFGQLELPLTTGMADACGGPYGTYTYASLCFGELILCGPVPPPPPDADTPKGAGGKRRRKIHQDEQDVEEIMLTVVGWLNMR